MQTLSMLRLISCLIAIAGFALIVTTSAEAMTPAPIHQPDGMIAKVRMGCGPGMVVVNGACVARSTIRQARRCARWSGGVCARWY
jgi:hypothetical protein